MVMALAVLLAGAQAQARSAPDSFADLAEQLLPSVVNISTTQVVTGRNQPQMPQLPPGSPFEEFFKEFFDRNQQQQPQQQRRATSLGSGFIIGSEGLVVTNNHVIDGSDEITVILHDDTRLEAELVGRDTKTDLAVLRVKTEHPLKAVSFGDSTKSRVGDWVVAIGNPFGLGGTVTAGIISARGRDINSGPYDDYIQTDASINRGNSGGPMFNLKGEVIGVNTAIYSPSGGSVGIGFAIPSSTVEPVINQLIKFGEVKRGWLGVHIQSVTEEIAETLGLDKAEGALVANVVEDGPAAKAQIKPGDVILTFGGRSVTAMRKLPRMVADMPVGEKVKVEIWRNGKKETLTVALGELEEGEQKMAAMNGGDSGSADVERTIDDLGLTVTAVTSTTRERYELADDARGVVVTGVAGDGPSAEKGIRPGDVIVEVGQEEVASPADVVDKVGKARKAGRRSVLLLLEGQSGLRFVAVKIDKG
ncbi:MAG: DegQ family serine endoprotease [Rhodobacterales bacterium]|nr:DegQ family serine endoprotease [Rhodobacterales bacterium]